MHPYAHAQSSVRKFGGRPEDYLPVHNWFDASKAHLADFRHRALRHHSEGIFLCEQVFGVTLTNASGREVPVRQVGEQHVLEDLGHIPSAADWLRAIQVQTWMMRAGPRPDNLAAETPAETLEPVALKPGEPIEPKAVQHYVLTGGVSCPYCNNNNIETVPGSQDSDDDWVTRKVWCPDCRHGWAEIFTLTDIEPVEP